ncbi:protein of unknown function (plasmid) [Caballeronia sp. S22]
MIGFPCATRVNRGTMRHAVGLMATQGTRSCWSMSRHMAGPGCPRLMCMSMENTLIEQIGGVTFPDSLQVDPSEILVEKRGRDARESGMPSEVARKRYRPDSLHSPPCVWTHAKFIESKEA